MSNPFAGMIPQQPPQAPVQQPTAPTAPANLFASLPPAPVQAQPEPTMAVQLADGSVVHMTRAQYDAAVAGQQPQAPVAPPTPGPVYGQAPPAPPRAPAAPVEKRGRGKPARSAKLELLHKCASSGMLSSEAMLYLALLDRVEAEGE